MPLSEKTKRFWRKAGNLSLDGVCFIIGSLIYAVAVNAFTAPNNIAPGGLSGAATLLNYLFGLPIGSTMLVLNLPLFIWGFISAGWRFLAKTAVATVLLSVAIDATAPFIPAYQGDMLLTVVFGGLASGFGLALIFMRGGTTGGTDLIASLIRRKLRHISLGRVLLFIDMIIVAISALVYRSFESPMYAILVIFITSKVMDTVLYGTDRGSGKMMFIVSPRNKDIAKGIQLQLDRGVTFLKSRGGYSGKEGEVLLCAVRRPEMHRTLDIVRSTDPDAFIIVGDAGDITGEGFRELQEK